MIRSVFVSTCAVSLAACASSGGGEASTPVPVFDAVAEVPCPYEVVRTVRGESSASVVGSPLAYERERAAVLGRAAARAGLDAVLVVPLEEIQGVQRRGTASAGVPGDAPRLTFVGEGLRYLDPECPARR